MDDRSHARQPRSLRKTAALLLSAVVAGSFFGPASAALAAEPGTGSIQGRLTSDAGRPVAGQVVAIDENTGQVFSATAESDGAYAITDVPAGRYAVLFRPSAAAVPDAPFGYVDAWFPNARRGDDAGRVIVDLGAETLAVDSSLRAAGQVTGALIGASGTYAVALLDEPTPVDPFDGDTLVAEVDDAGGFALRAPEGAYELLVYRLEGYDWQPYRVGEAPVVVTIGSDVALPSVSLPEPGALELVLHDADGGLAAEADVTLTRQDSARIERDCLTDREGRALFAGLAPGFYTVDGVGDGNSPDVVVSSGRVTALEARPTAASSGSMLD